MAWRTVQQDGAIEIYGSLFYYRGDPPYDVGPGTRLWVVDGDQMDRIMVWVDQKRHDFRGIWGCQTVWDEANLFHRPETAAQTRLRHLRDKAKEAVEDVRAALNDAEQAIDAFPATPIDRTAVDVAVGEFEAAMRPLLVQEQKEQEIGVVRILATFMAFNPDKDANVHNLRTEVFSFGYPVYAEGLSHQETADELIDGIIASWDSLSIKRFTQEEIAALRKVGEDWSWDDTDMETDGTRQGDTVASAGTSQQTSGDDPS